MFFKFMAWPIKLLNLNCFRRNKKITYIMLRCVRTVFKVTQLQRLSRFWRTLTEKHRLSDCVHDQYETRTPDGCCKHQRSLRKLARFGYLAKRSWCCDWI